jgi:hypothetical protein
VAHVNVTSPKAEGRCRHGRRQSDPPVQVLPRGAFPPGAICWIGWTGPVGAGAAPGSPPVAGV